MLGSSMGLLLSGRENHLGAPLSLNFLVPGTVMSPRKAVCSVYLNQVFTTPGKVTLISKNRNNEIK